MAPEQPKLVRRSILATLMLLSGAANMLILKYSDMTKAIGRPPENATSKEPLKPHYYHHPIVQGIGMFGGEALCLLFFWITNSRAFYNVMAKLGRGGQSGSNRNGEGHDSGYSEDDYGDSNNNYDNDDSSASYSEYNDERQRLAQSQENLVAESSRQPTSGGNASSSKVRSFFKRVWKHFSLYARFFLPSLLDCIATVTVFYGLTFTFPSSTQMLRGSVQIFRCVITYFLVDKNLQKHKIVGLVLLISGLSIIVYTDYSVIMSEDTKNNYPEKAELYKHILYGDCLVVLAQISTAFQIYLEEYSTMLPDGVESVEAVGWEGVWGVLFLSIIVIPFSYLRVPGSDVVGRYTPNKTFEDVKDALLQMQSEKKLIVATIAQVFSVCIFNISGINYVLMNNSNGMWRMALDTLRTVFIWVISLIFGWQLFVPVQIIGFTVQIVGLCWFNQLMLPKCLYPEMIYGQNETSESDDSEYSDGNLSYDEIRDREDQEQLDQYCDQQANNTRNWEQTGGQDRRLVADADEELLQPGPTRR